jgi:hypothetical protein
MAGETFWPAMKGMVEWIVKREIDGLAVELKLAIRDSARISTDRLAVIGIANFVIVIAFWADEHWGSIDVYLIHSSAECGEDDLKTCTVI